MNNLFKHVPNVYLYPLDCFLNDKLLGTKFEIKNKTTLAPMFESGTCQRELPRKPHSCN